MKRLSYIELENFRSWRKPARIELPETGLVLLKGVNHDTGGGSGSGKTTIPLAVNYGLGECEYPATALKSWWDDEPMRVGLGFTDGFKIDRGTKGLKVVDTDGEKMKGGISQKEEKIAQYLGTDVKTALMLTYRGQRQRGFFISVTDAAKKDFLTKVLDLGKYEKQIEDSEARVKKLETELLVLRAEHQAAVTAHHAAPVIDASHSQERLRALGADLAAAEYRLAELRQQIGALEESCAADAQATRAVYQDRIQAGRERAKAALSVPQPPVDRTELEHWNDVVRQCRDRLDRLGKEHDAKVRARETLVSGMSARIGDLMKTVGAEDNLASLRANVERDIARMAVDKCPTCQQDWDHAQKHREQLVQKLGAIDEALAVCAAAREEVEAIRHELLAVPQVEKNASIEKIQKVRDEAMSKAGAAQSAIISATTQHEAHCRANAAEAQAELAVLMAEVSSQVEAVKADYRERTGKLQEQVDEAWRSIHEIQGAQENHKRMVVESEWAAAQKETLRKQEDAAHERLLPKEVELCREQDFQQLIGREGFLGSIFDEVLEQIGDEANRLLAAVANTRHVTIRFQSENLTQKGTVKREIRPIVSVGGFEAPLESALSGGMKGVVELAVDLALAAVVAERSGVRLGWLVLDEALDGLGPVEKDSALEILGQYAQDRLVLVVDHSSEFQSSFSRTIEVEMRSGESRVTSSRGSL